MSKRTGSNIHLDRNVNVLYNFRKHDFFDE